MDNMVITKMEQERLEKLLQLMLDHPKAAVTEGWRRQANLFDDLDFIYTACSSGKDSVFMLEMALMELQRRKWVAQLWENGQRDESQKIMDRFSQVRQAGLASQRSDDIQLMLKWKDMRIGMMQMPYELDYDQSVDVMMRLYKEYATDFEKILPDHPVDPNKSVKENGFDLRWVDYERAKRNPYEIPGDEIEKLAPDQLREVYGKALMWGWGCYFPIAWENLNDPGSSRYISYDPDLKNLWVNEPPEQFDPHREWCITLEHMYDSWHGLPPMLEILPGHSDQHLRVEFSKYISNSIPKALAFGWPQKQFNMQTAQYE